MTTVIKLRSLAGEVLFQHSGHNNTVKATVLEAVAEGVSLKGVNLAFSDLQGANLAKADLSGAALIGVDLREARITNTNLYDANLMAANLTGARIAMSELARVDMSEASLVNACFSHTNLRAASLRGVNAEHVKFKEAHLSGAIFDLANLAGATFDGSWYGRATLEKGLLCFFEYEWPVYVFDAHIKIGCQMHTTDEWEAFSDVAISRMDADAKRFWDKHKQDILSMAKAHQQSE